MYDLIILGGGPAGLTAAAYALHKRLNVLLISRDLGGKTNYRLQLPQFNRHLVIDGEEIVSRFAGEIEYHNAARVFDTAEQVEAIRSGETLDGYRVTVTGGQEYTARALVVATGSSARRLNVPGEADFLMRGVVYSAVSYAPLFVDGVTAVVGDSPLALRAAADLARFARRVTLIAPNEADLGSPLGRQVIGLPNVIVLTGWQVERVFGDSYARGLVVSRGAERREISADGIFVELGLVPNTGPLAGLVESDAAGRIKVDTHNCTSAPGLFAAGDVTDVYAEQVLVAIGEGAKAALSAFDYLLAHPVRHPTGAVEWR
jgi:alkyl hydroperoxide reductase subunit AhpF